MSNYKCIRTFISSFGQGYWYGNKIAYIEYARLPYSEQNNFALIRDEEKEMKHVQQDDVFNANDLETTRED